MQESPKLSYFIFLLSVFGHLFPVLLIIFNLEDLDVTNQYVVQFIISVSISFSFSVLLLIRSHRINLYIIFITKILLFIVITHTLDDIIIVKALFGSSIFIEIGYNIEFPQNLVLSCIFLLCLNIFSIVFLHLVNGLDRFSLLSFSILNSSFIFVISLATMTSYYKKKSSYLSQRLNQMETAVQQLSEANIRFQQHTIDVAEKSMLNERNRISRELHDSTTYSLTNLRMMIEASMYLLQSNTNLEKLKETLENAYNQTLEGLQNIRTALRNLRAFGQSNLIGLKAIERMVRSFERATGVTINTEYTNTPMSCGSAIDSFLYRFVQEGMTNSLRHGKATEISILLEENDNHLTIVVRDNGFGAKSIEEGIGFSGMKERLAKLDGVFSAKTVSDGFEIMATIPLNHQKEKSHGKDTSRVSR
jgi:signal transduction histidine kinase